MSEDYHNFIAGKTLAVSPVGFECDVESVHLFAFQRDIVQWALRRGRAAIFAGTGLGKTRMQLTWAHHVSEHTSKRVIIVAPLAVTAQTIREAEAIGLSAQYCKTPEDVSDDSPNIILTNYERLERFEDRLDLFDGVVLDESSILKALDGKLRTLIIGMFGRMPYRLACTATPAPNDFTELGNHSQFLSVMNHNEMLSMFFVHDGYGATRDWRLKGHAKKAFWKWVCSWAAFVRFPSDLGYDDGAYQLPPLKYHSHQVEVDQVSLRAEGMLFAMDARTLSERREARKASLSGRVAELAAMVNESSDQWIVWCDLNDEGNALEKAIEGSVQVAGCDSPEFKEQAALDFIDGKTRVLISKASIFGFGLNFQGCHKMAFVGLSDSWEAYYQAVRRCWRFGQKNPVDVHIFSSVLDVAVVSNIERKEADADTMAREMSKFTSEFVKANVKGATHEKTEYNPKKAMKLPSWVMKGSDHEEV